VPYSRQCVVLGAEANTEPPFPERRVVGVAYKHTALVATRAPWSLRAYAEHLMSARRGGPARASSLERQTYAALPRFCRKHGIGLHDVSLVDHIVLSGSATDDGTSTCDLCGAAIPRDSSGTPVLAALI
jgi:hypothetical protein